MSSGSALKRPPCLTLERCANFAPCETPKDDPTGSHGKALKGWCRVRLKGSSRQVSRAKCVQTIICKNQKPEAIIYILLSTD